MRIPLDEILLRCSEALVFIQAPSHICQRLRLYPTLWCLSYMFRFFEVHDLHAVDLPQTLPPVGLIESPFLASLCQP
jgi:hypothetical protein